MESVFNIVYEYVKLNPNQSVIDIAKNTGINELTVHRHLNGGRSKEHHVVFLRVKSTKKLMHPDGVVRGSYIYLYSINPIKSKYITRSTKKQSNKSPKFVRDPITAALFGCVV